MTYKVTVTLEHPAHAPLRHEIEGPESHSPQSVSDTLVQAIKPIQQQFGVEPTTFDELVASRGTFGTLSSLLDELGVEPGPYKGMLGLAYRVGTLANEVRELRLNADASTTVVPGYQRIVSALEGQRNAAYEKIAAHGEVINGVRHALDLPPGAPDAEFPDAELPRIVGELQHRYETTYGSLQRTVETIREVRAGLDVSPETRDGQLGRVAGLEHETLSMIERDMVGLVFARRPDESASLAQRAGMRWGMLLARFKDVDAKLKAVLSALRLPLGTNMSADELESAARQMVSYSDSWLARGDAGSPATPDRLAEVLFDASRAVSRVLGSEPIPAVDKPGGWAVASGQRRQWWREVAALALDRTFVNVPTGLLPVTAEELARAIHDAIMEHPNPDGDVVDESFEDAPPEWNAWRLRVSRATLDRLPSIAAPKQSARTPLLPQTLAELLVSAMVEQRVADGGREGDALPVFPWDDMLGIAQGFWVGVAERVKGAVEAYRPSGGATPLPVTPGQVARALHGARKAVLGSGPALWLTVPWEHLDGRTRDFVTRVAEVMLSELPQIARADAESDEQFAAHVDASLAELRRENRAAVEAFRKIAALVGMSFGEADSPAALGMFTAEAVAQLKRERDEIERAGSDANSDMHQYRGMVMFVADQLGLSADTVDDPKRFGDAVRAELERRAGKAAAFTFCVPRPEDWMVRLDALDGVSSLAWPHGAQVTVDGVVCKVGFVYMGGEPVRSLAEELAKAWLETPSATGGGFAWDEVPDLHETYREHARQVIERLARLGRKQGFVVDFETAFEDAFTEPGAFFARDEAGEVVQGRAPLVSDVEPVSAFARELAVVLGLEASPPQGGAWPWSHLMSRVAELVQNDRNVVSVSRDHHEELRAALGVKSVGWDELMADTRSWSATLVETRRLLVEARREVSGRSEDLSRALGLNSGESWEDMIEIVTGRTAGDATLSGERKRVEDVERQLRLERNALAEICRILGLHERLFPSAVVDAVRDLRESWGVMEEWLPRLFGLLGIDVYVLSGKGNVAQAMGKAFDRTGELKAAAVFEPHERGDAKRVKDAVFTLLEAAHIDVEDDDANVAVQKAGDAAAILRSWPDVLRAVNAFDNDEVEQPDEVEPLLRSFAEVYYKADRRGRATRAIERLLAAHRGEPLQDNLDTMYERLDKLIGNLFEPLREVGLQYGVNAADYVDKQRFAEHVLMHARNHVALSPAPMWASFAEQVAVRFESWAKAGLDVEPMSKLVTVPGVGIRKDRQTLEFAADVVREHAAALVSGAHPHPLVMALQDNTFWAPDSGVSELELVPDADGDVVFRDDTQSANGKALGLLVLDRRQLAPVGVALLALAYHRVREADSERQADEKSIREAAEVAAGAEEVLAVGPIRVTPSVPHEWCYGPNLIDPDPAKRWHIGCGGEVSTLCGVDTCGECGHEWTPESAARSKQRAEEFRAAIELTDQQEAADESDRDTES